jgi:hypothetical protein
MRLLPLLMIASLLHAPADSKAKTCGVNWDGFVVGVSRERNVVALYGAGFEDPAGGDTGARYYTPPDHTFTVEVEFGVDHIIDSITVTKGLHPPRHGSAVVAKMETAALHADKIVGLWRAAALGSSKERVRHFVGSPETEGDLWTYDLSCSECDSESTLLLTFDSKGKLQKIEISDFE